METIIIFILLAITLIIMLGIVVYRTIKAIFKIIRFIQSVKPTTYKSKE